MGEKRLLVLVLAFGAVLNLSVALVLVQYDRQSLLSKVCNHYSEKNLEILQQYMVR
jgi:hypothetical protein